MQASRQGAGTPGERRVCVQRYTLQANQIAAFWLTRHRVVRKTGWRAGASGAHPGMKRHEGKGKPA